MNTTLVSPRLPDGTTAAWGRHRGSSMSEDELAGLVRMAQARGAAMVAVGTGRDPASVHAGRRLAAAWRQAGGQVVAMVDWPEQAASWLRQAHRLTHSEPDLWVFAGTPVGLAQMTRRLVWSTPWTPRRTLAVRAGIDQTARLAGLGVLDGLAGAGEDGTFWRIHDGLATTITWAEATAPRGGRRHA
ncbi:hypothetical protein ACQP25_33975 [Microtetraspora malaysiensis]|uniref:hypothetical protein n=1 Tax=Microtetraspora malaysiensis TaxID=161358 RepID=UPI003D94E084